MSACHLSADKDLLVCLQKYEYWENAVTRGSVTTLNNVYEYASVLHNINIKILKNQMKKKEETRELLLIGSWLKDTLRMLRVPQGEIMKTAGMGSGTLRKCLNGKTCM